MTAKFKLPKQDINLEPFMRTPPQFNRKTIVMRTDKVYKCEIVNIVDLTSMEKLFHLKILDSAEREIFSFRPGHLIFSAFFFHLKKV